LLFDNVDMSANQSSAINVGDFGSILSLLFHNKVKKGAIEHPSL
jgi:hypothetical protein